MSELLAAFGINWKLLLVQAANFGLVLLIMWRYLYQPILRVIDERQKKIAEGVQTALAAKQKLEDASARSHEIVGKADREAEMIVAAARARSAETQAELLKEAEAKAQGIVKDAIARAEETKRQVFLGTTRDIAQAAMLAAEKILNQKSA